MKSKIFTSIGILLCVLWITPNKVFSQETKTATTDVFEMSLEDLMNQNVITVSKSEEKMLDAPGIIEVLTKDDIHKFGGTTLSSILERIPGLIATTAAISDRSIITFRGEQTTATSNHVLLLLNGRPIRETLEGGVSSEMYESFPTNCIERIEVIKGPGSVLYGSNAFSGIINIITRTPEKTGVTISGLSGPTGTLGGHVNVNIKANDLNVTIAGRYLKKPDWKVNYSYNSNQTYNQGNNNDSITPVTPMPADSVNGNNESNPTANTSANSGTDPSSNTNPSTNNSPQMLNSEVSIPNQSAALLLNAAYKNINFTTSYNQWETTGFDSPGNVSWQKLFSDLGYNLKFNEKWNSNINVSITNSKIETDSFPDIHRNSYELLAEWTHFITLSEKMKIVFGGLYSFTHGKETNTISTEEQVGIDNERHSFAAYAQADYWLLKTVKLTGGLQINKIKYIDFNLVPRAGIIWNPSEHFNFKALYGQAFRAPSLNEVYLNQPFMLGNTALEPEKVGTIDVGTNYTSEHLQLGLNYFHSKLYNIIALDYSYSVPTYENQGKVVFQGAEFEGKFYFNKNIYLTCSALYQINKNDDDKTNVTPIANFGAKAGASYQSENGISVSLFDIYQGALDDSYKTDSNVSPESAYNKLSLHCDIDMNKLMHSNIKQQISLFLHADNILNRQIWLPAWGDDTGKSIPYDQGRIFYTGLSITF